jgi:hypothetical protein
MLNRHESLSNRKLLDGVNLLAGLALAASPWILGYAAETTASWNAWATGALIAVMAIGAILKFHEAEEWGNLALGLWSLLAPWGLGFSGLDAGMKAHVAAARCRDCVDLPRQGRTLAIQLRKGTRLNCRASRPVTGPEAPAKPHIPP